MANYCKITLIGHLGSDPEGKDIGDNHVVNFSLAVNPFKKRGEPDPDPIWYRIAVWGKSGEACERYLSKGRPVYVEGELTPREYQDRDGRDRTSLDVRANVVQFLGGKDEGSGASADSGRRDPGPNPAEEDLPF